MSLPLTNILRSGPRDAGMRYRLVVSALFHSQGRDVLLHFRQRDDPNRAFLRHAYEVVLQKSRSRHVDRCDILYGVGEKGPGSQQLSISATSQQTSS